MRYETRQHVVCSHTREDNSKSRENNHTGILLGVIIRQLTVRLAIAFHTSLTKQSLEHPSEGGQNRLQRIDVVATATALRRSGAAGRITGKSWSG